MCSNNYYKNNYRCHKIVYFFLFFLNLAICNAGIQHIEDENVIMNSDDEDSENVDVNNIIQTLRKRLKKYLYYPSRSKGIEGSFPAYQYDAFTEQQHQPSAVIELISSGEAPDAIESSYCEQCGRRLVGSSKRSRKSIIKFCGKCRFLMRKHGKRMKHIHSQRYYNQNQHRIEYSVSTKNQTMATTNNPINIFKKLNKLGTSIYYETDCKDTIQKQNTTNMIRNAHEINTIDNVNETNGLQHRTTTTHGTNEILMTFNTVVTEVFPIHLLYNHSKCDQQTNQMHGIASTMENGDETNQHSSLQDILKNVPKSLTITMT